MKTTTTMAILAGLLVCTGAQAQEVLRFGHVYTTDRRDHLCAVDAAEAIKERTDGRYEIRVFPNSELGGEAELHQQLSLGSVDLAFVSGPFASASYPPISVETAPFVLRDYDHWNAYRASDIYRELVDGYAKATGNTIFSTHYQGAWHVLSDNPVRVPADMAGLKMRVPNAPTWLAFPRAVGAVPAPIAYAEAYLALQQGVVDIMDQGLGGVVTMKFNEVRDTLNMTGHLVISVHTIASASLLGRLSEEDRAIFTEVFAEMADTCSQAVRGDEGVMLADLVANGMEVVEVDRPAFQDAIATFAASNDLGWSQENYARIQAID